MSASPQESSAFKTLTTLAQQELALKIRFKDESKKMKALNTVMKWFVKDFMTRFTTTWGYTVYFPSRAYVKANPKLATRILAHELVHLLDTKRHGKLIFTLGYLFPQILALGVFSFPWLGWWALLFLGFLLPFPAPFRFYYESRGYAVSMMTRLDDRSKPELYLPFFTTWIYYKMYPFKKKVCQKLLYWEDKTRKGEAPVLQKVMDWYLHTRVE